MRGFAPGTSIILPGRKNKTCSGVFPVQAGRRVVPDSRPSLGSFSAAARRPGVCCAPADILLAADAASLAAAAASVAACAACAADAAAFASDAAALSRIIYLESVLAEEEDEVSSGWLAPNASLNDWREDT